MSALATSAVGSMGHWDLVVLTVVNNEDDSSAAASTSKAECSLVAFHGIDGTHQRGVVTVEGGNKVTDAYHSQTISHSQLRTCAYP